MANAAVEHVKIVTPGQGVIATAADQNIVAVSAHHKVIASPA